MSAGCPLPWEPPQSGVTSESGGSTWGLVGQNAPCHGHIAQGQSRWQLRGAMGRKAHLRPDPVFVFVVALTKVAGVR